MKGSSPNDSIINNIIEGEGRSRMPVIIDILA